MKRILFFRFNALLIALLSVTALSATTIKGTVKDTHKQPVPFANVILKDSYDGASVDANGNFSFETDVTGPAVLICRQLGYEEQEKTVTISGGTLEVDFILVEKVNEMDVVVISAGTIEASDEKRTTVLKPLDIVTTAGSSGDMYGALQTLPGTSRVGDQEGLFVRGGTGAETKTIIDGMNVNNPFFTSVPDIASRGRFSPFLFKGTVFSTGGYSAQYGQALSSALVLETQDLPDRTSSTLAISSVGVGGGHNQLWEKKGMSIGADANYTNLAPYFAIVPQLPDYVRKPQFFGGSLNFRKKTGDNGILKFYGYINYGDLALRRPDVDSTNGYQSLFDLHNTNTYTNLSWRQYLNVKWRIDAAGSWSYNLDKIILDDIPVSSESALSQGRLMGTRYFMTRNQLRFGTEYQYVTESNSYDTLHRGFIDNYVSGFAEADIFLGPRFVARVGGRVENSSLLAKTNFAPRVSLAAKTGKYSQLSLAYGDFYQKPANDLLYISQQVGFEKATHYILSFQHVDDSITFRVEAYYKAYDQLVKTVPSVVNSGDGFARGIDIFWRDKKSFHNVDYWVSYTFLDTKRNWRDFPEAVQPTFAGTHNASVVFKKFFPAIMTSIGASYFYASGRPYFNPNSAEFLHDKTYDYHSLNLNASYLTRLFGAFTVIAVSVTNVTGFNQVFGYRYSYDGMRREAIGPPAKRSFFIGVFMSFGQDRSKDVINNNN
jgi:hypothetical protein